MLHLMIVVLLLMIPWQGYRSGDEGQGDVVQLGTLEDIDLSLSEPDIDEFRELLQPAPQNEESRSLPDLQMPLNFDPFSKTQVVPNVSLSTGGPESNSELDVSIPQSAAVAGQEDFGDLISRLQRDGLDIVITFDSTGSMDREIRQVKRQIRRIGNALFQLIPKTRISICTYRDTDDRYLVQGLPLTDDLTQIVEYLEGIDTGGGNDIPEGVDAGLAWSIEQNSFRAAARKVILIFGDAPPHAQNYNRCLRLAADFHEQQGGIISTVTCHNQTPLPVFVEIARLGGGEAFLSHNDRAIMSQLIVLVFGSEHRQKVLQAFQLLDP